MSDHPSQDSFCKAIHYSSNGAVSGSNQAPSRTTTNCQFLDGSPIGIAEPCGLQKIHKNPYIKIRKKVCDGTSRMEDIAFLLYSSSEMKKQVIWFFLGRFYLLTGLAALTSCCLKITLPIIICIVLICWQVSLFSPRVV
jgi:hypothetical protein